MPGSTSTTSSTVSGLHAETSFPPQISTKNVCNTCQVSFDDWRSQRSHMKGEWHLHNLQRRLASLPAVTFDTFEDDLAKTRSKTVNRMSRTPSPLSIDGSNDSGNLHFSCLFCDLAFPEDNAGLFVNVEHMELEHGFIVPHLELVNDLKTFIRYLSDGIRTWHECLYCGAVKSRVSSIQNHMRDKGHCLLNFDREPGLLGFWDESAQIVAKDFSHALMNRLPDASEDLHLASGKIIGSRSAPREPRVNLPRPESREDRSRARRHQDPPTTTDMTVQQPDYAQLLRFLETTVRKPERQLAQRDEMGITGITEQQRHALMAAEKKAQRSEAVARRAREWIYAKGANLQKYDQIDGKMKHGKQNHKLQPR